MCTTPSKIRLPCDDCLTLLRNLEVEAGRKLTLLFENIDSKMLKLKGVETLLQVAWRQRKDLAGISQHIL